MHALDVWHTNADAFEREILIRQEMAAKRRPTAAKAIGALKVSGLVLHNAAFDGVLAEGLIACRRHEDVRIGHYRRLAIIRKFASLPKVAIPKHPLHERPVSALSR